MHLHSQAQLIRCCLCKSHSSKQVIPAAYLMFQIIVNTNMSAANKMELDNPNLGDISRECECLENVDV